MTVFYRWWHYYIESELWFVPSKRLKSTQLALFESGVV